MYIKLVNCYVLFNLNEKPTLGAGLSFFQFRHKLVSLSVLQVFFSGMGSHLCDRGEEQQTAQEKKRTCPWERCEVKHFQQRSLLFILWHKSTCSEKKKSQVHPWEFGHHCKKAQQGLCWCHTSPVGVCWMFYVPDLMVSSLYVAISFTWKPEETLFSTQDSQSWTPGGCLKRAFPNDFCRT